MGYAKKESVWLVLERFDEKEPDRRTGGKEDSKKKGLEENGCDRASGRKRQRKTTTEGLSSKKKNTTKKIAKFSQRGRDPFRKAPVNVEQPTKGQGLTASGPPSQLAELEALNQSGKSKN